MEGWKKLDDWWPTKENFILAVYVDPEQPNVWQKITIRTENISILEPYEEIHWIPFPKKLRN